jgi:transketolase
MMSKTNEYEQKVNNIRKRILRTVYTAKVGHLGGSLSAVEILTALYFEVLKLNPQEPKWSERDIFILSKGHAAAGLYSVLTERGLLNEAEVVNTFGRIDSRFQVHPDAHKVDWVEIATGSLGQGLSIGIGAALAAKFSNLSNRVYVLLGDGECQEGQVWEAAMSAAHYHLDNIVAIVDYNQGQLSDRTEKVINVAPLTEKWQSFGWQVVEVDGHSVPDLIAAFNWAKNIKGKPVVIIANTLKAKGISFMETEGYQWHGKVPTEEEFTKAMAELEATGGR